MLRKVKIKKGDFFHVPTGTIDALKKGMLVLETQQSSDTTYLLYDYDRLGDDGQPRPLHLKQSIDVSTIPYQEETLNYEIKEIDNHILTTSLLVITSMFINGVFEDSIHEVIQKI